MNENLLQNERMGASDLADEKITKAIKDARLRLAESNPSENINTSSTGAKKRSRKSGKSESAPRGASQEEIQRMSAELDKMFNADNFRGLVRAPADLMLALTGNKIWDIPHEEVETLAVTGSTCARYFLSTDPKWLALTLFSMAALTTYGTRIAIHLQDKKSGVNHDKKT